MKWIKSSLSFSNGNCVEVALCQNGDCVEVGKGARGSIYVRDSKDRSGPALMFTPDEWRAFLGGVLRLLSRKDLGGGWWSRYAPSLLRACS